MPIKFLLLGGGRGFYGRGGGGSANFIFMGVGIFPDPRPTYFCDSSWKMPRHGNADHLMSFQRERVSQASHFCRSCRSCAGTEIISEAPFFDFLI